MIFFRLASTKSNVAFYVSHVQTLYHIRGDPISVTWRTYYCHRSSATKHQIYQAVIDQWHSSISAKGIIISYCISTAKYWLHAIFKENELASSPLILHKANILWYWCNDCFIVWLEFFVAPHNDSASRPSVYVAQQIFCLKICRIILRRLFLGMKVKVKAFSVL